MKRDCMLSVRMTSQEKEIIAKTAANLGVSMNKMLRFLGLHADKSDAARRSLRELTALINHLNLIATSPDMDTNLEDAIPAMVAKAIAPLRTLEEALALPREIEQAPDS